MSTSRVTFVLHVILLCLNSVMHFVMYSVTTLTSFLPANGKDKWIAMQRRTCTSISLLFSEVLKAFCHIQKANKLSQRKKLNRKRPRINMPIIYHKGIWKQEKLLNLCSISNNENPKVLHRNNVDAGLKNGFGRLIKRFNFKKLSFKKEVKKKKIQEGQLFEN